MIHALSRVRASSRSETSSHWLPTHRASKHNSSLRMSWPRAAWTGQSKDTHVTSESNHDWRYHRSLGIQSLRERGGGSNPKKTTKNPNLINVFNTAVPQASRVDPPGRTDGLISSINCYIRRQANTRGISERYTHWRLAPNCFILFQLWTTETTLQNWEKANCQPQNEKGLQQQRMLGGMS